MSSTVPEDLWSSQLSDVLPRDLLTRLTSHTTKSTQFNEQLADYFRARGAVEAEYAAALNKLTRKFGEGMGVDKGTGEAGLWERVMGEVVETASASNNLSETLSREFETPLRSLPSRLPSLSRLPGLQDKASKQVKLYESALDKTQKASKKGGSKLQAAQNELTNQTSSLSQLLPSVISTQQTATLDRLRELKELGIKYETLLAENGNRRVEGSERGMNRMLGWEIEDEVRNMGVRVFGGNANASSGAAGGAGTVRANGVGREMGGRDMGTPSRTSTLRRPTMESNYSSTMNRPTSASPRPSDNNLPKEHSSLTSTLKSKFSRKSSLLGTVGLGTSNSNSGGSFTGGRGRSESNATVRTSTTGRGPQAGGPGGFESLADQRDSYETGRNGVTVASPISGTPRVDEEGFSLPPENRGQAPWERPATNGGTPRNLLDEDDDDERDNISPLPSASGSTFGAPKLNMALAPLPIQEDESSRQAALQKMQSTLLSQPPSAPGRKNTIRGRRDVRNTTFNTLPDDMPLAQALKLQGQQEDTVDRNREGQGEAGQEVLATPTTSVFGAGAASTMNQRGSVVSPMIPQFTGRDNGNGTAMSSPTSVIGSTNPFDQGASVLTGSGLRATITETVHVVSKGGLAQKAMVNGEICVTIRELSKYASTNGSDPIHIRLDEFEQLEKVAPNPKFLSQVPERPGEYYLKPEVLAHATASQSTRPVLFKYQLHVGEGRAGDFAPIEVHPQWKIAPGDNRLLINYKSNDEGRLARRLRETGEGMGRLTEISVVAGLGGPEITQVQAKPQGGTWSAERRRMVWNVSDVDFDPSSGSSAGKIVARFLSSAEGPLGRPEGVSLRWKCEGSLTSGLNLSVVSSNDGWRFEEVGKAVVSGKYTAE